MRFLRSLALVPALAVAGHVANAQQVTSDSSHRAAVQRLMQVIHVREMTEQSGEAILNGQLQQMPQLAPYADILREFYHEQMNWASLEPEYTRLYLEVFSEAELRDLIAFYESPLGQKLLAKMPVLLAKSNEITTRRLQAAMPQLMQRLQAAAVRAPAAAPPDSTQPTR